MVTLVKIFPFIQNLHPRHSFNISRARKTQASNVIFAVEEDGIVGLGEASPDAFYHETSAEVVDRLRQLEGFFHSLRIESVADIAAAWEEIWPRISPSRATQCAVDLALWDLLGRKTRTPVTRLALQKSPREILSSFTIGLSTPEELQEKVAGLQGFPIIKLKMDASADLGPIRYIQAHSSAVLRVDANCAWAAHDVPALSRQLAALKIEFIEQPLPPNELSRMPEILRQSSLPILADESCVQIEDVERMPGNFSGFNIKLVKCGGLTAGLRMLRRGRELGLRMMVGCMLETNLLIAAGAVVGQETDYADLDGSWLLSDDPFTGIRYTPGRLQLSDAPGFGVHALPGRVSLPFGGT